MKILFTTVRAIIYAFFFILIWYWVALAVRVYDKDIGIQLPNWFEIPGIILIALGGVIALSCIGVFIVRGKGTAAPFDAPREFVAIGPYRFVRNPMYIGGGITLLGFGLYELSISILIFTIIWFFLFHLFIVFVEEPGLETRFGQSYINYKKSVNRWIPKQVNS